MANFFKEEIEQFGETVDGSIQNASKQIQLHIDSIGKELNNQRSLTKADLEALIDYSADKFGKSIDLRIAVAKLELATLVTEKVTEVRGQLSQAKRTAIRNATIAVGAAIAIGIISLIYQHVFNNQTNLLTVVRASIAAIGCGHVVWLVQKYLGNYLSLSQSKKNILIVGAQYFGVLKPKGALGHILILLLVVSVWVTLNSWPTLINILSKLFN